MRLTFLGTGTSFGVPVIGCDCDTCRSLDPRDNRTRHGALLDLPAGRLLVDAPPELRVQLLREGVRRIDAVWFTHMHADHVHGIDDLRVFGARGQALPAYVAREHAGEIAERFRYIFDPTVPPLEGSRKPELRVHPIDALTPVDILGESFTPLRVPHGSTDVYGFRVGLLGYVTDGKSLPPEVLRALAGVEVLVINALWFGSPHPTHFNVEEALAASETVGARRTYLTHLTHRVSHAELARRLPSGVEPAFDGLAVDL